MFVVRNGGRAGVREGSMGAGEVAYLGDGGGERHERNGRKEAEHGGVCGVRKQEIQQRDSNDSSIHVTLTKELFG